jgi:hypothetical protein
MNNLLFLLLGFACAKYTSTEESFYKRDFVYTTKFSVAKDDTAIFEASARLLNYQKSRQGQTQYLPVEIGIFEDTVWDRLPSESSCNKKRAMAS